MLNKSEVSCQTRISLLNRTLKIVRKTVHTLSLVVVNVISHKSFHCRVTMHEMGDFHIEGITILRSRLDFNNSDKYLNCELWSIVVSFIVTSLKNGKAYIVRLLYLSLWKDLRHINQCNSWAFAIQGVCFFYVLLFLNKITYD